MSHDKHVIDNVNKDVEILRLEGVTNRHEAKEYYLELAKGWEDPNPNPVVEEYDGVRVVRDDLITGSKIRGGDCLISGLNHSTLVYEKPLDFLFPPQKESLIIKLVVLNGVLTTSFIVLLPCLILIG